MRRASFGAKDEQIALLDRLLPRVRAIPGVDAVSPVGNAPFLDAGIDFRPAIEGQTPTEVARNPFVNIEAITPDYFATFGIPLIAGRLFTDADRAGGAPVAIVSRSVADRFWPGATAIGKRLHRNPSYTVVGVVPDTRYRELRNARPSVYLPLRQSPFPFAPTTLAIRAHGQPSTIVPALRAIIADVDPGVALTTARPFEELLAQPLAHPRLNTALLAVFAFAALLLAGVGLFGVMAAMVRQRRGELAVRMALGATSGEIGRRVLRRGVKLAAIGVATGLGVAIVTNHLLQEILYRVKPTDAATLLGATASIIVLALLASSLPAVASARIDPVGALRGDD